MDTFSERRWWWRFTVWQKYGGEVQRRVRCVPKPSSARDWGEAPVMRSVPPLGPRRQRQTLPAQQRLVQSARPVITASSTECSTHTNIYTSYKHGWNKSVISNFHLLILRWNMSPIFSRIRHPFLSKCMLRMRKRRKSTQCAIYRLHYLIICVWNSKNVWHDVNV